VLTHPDVDGIWARLITNHAHAMRIEVYCGRGEFTPTMVEKLGFNVKIRQHKNGTDEVQFWLYSMSQLDTEQFDTLIRESIVQLSHQPADGEEATS